eukprot:CAMPEP_0197309780 /NCGR_PEP_ID=MMETSP0891-20130614/8400_1 /TAXON_ID=44058 ORGANISM="Aureoumbra lagunensis, Strain CCMP1510" /NCGR_SAMPLE_ID=MMETSP0891 /ASSEMBLY_ACC=CAM_ASM_000534 /LENGTH=662 /DNA_ID=CAMNT_0042795071 /DNA_START=87 /DNA_END=2075 /DNA_ORIENTATION=+
MTKKKKDIQTSAEWKRALHGIAKIARPDLGLFLLAMLFAILAALATSTVSLLTGDALDALIKHGSGTKFKRLIAILAVVAAVGALATGVRGGLFSFIGVRINVRVREKLFRHLLTLELSFFDATPTGDLNSRLASDTAKIGDQVSLNSNVLIRTFVQLLTTLAFMIHISFPLSLLALASVPVVSVATKRYGEYVWSLARAMQDKLAAAMKVAEEVFATMATVRSCAGERSSAFEFSQALEQYRRVGQKQACAYAGWQIFNTSLPTLMTCLLLYQGGRLVDRGHLQSGRLVAFNLLTQTLTDTFSTLADMFSNIFDALGASDKVFALLAKDPDPTEAAPQSPWDKPKMKRDPANTTDPTLNGLVEIENVRFRYPGRPQVQVLCGINIRVAAGSVCALVGPSGSGKSSIIALIQRFYAPESGIIRIDGIDVADFDHAQLHRRVALVSQEPVLFARTIRRNVAYALEDTELAPSEEDIQDALHMAHASDFVSNLPEGLDTDVGERGVALSGGQKQRIAIARALCRKPRILLLDEATSALDTESERKVQRALDDLIAAHSLTVIVVAHRLSTIQNADSICCIKKGQLIERGTHSELMAIPGGVYADLVRRQAVRGGSSTSDNNNTRTFSHDVEDKATSAAALPVSSMKLLSDSNLSSKSIASDKHD